MTRSKKIISNNVKKIFFNNAFSLIFVSQAETYLRKYSGSVKLQITKTNCMKKSRLKAGFLF
ncbi:MAG: hypothetical protein C5B59_11160 [Bacteroidetes bacterium]|nr:MAG: hypothetical protein C5B59_11160 [Bacteroidota bacterium]